MRPPSHTGWQQNSRSLFWCGDCHKIFDLLTWSTLFPTPSWPESFLPQLYSSPDMDRSMWWLHEQITWKKGLNQEFTSTITTACCTYNISYFRGSNKNRSIERMVAGLKTHFDNWCCVYALSLIFNSGLKWVTAHCLFSISMRWASEDMSWNVKSNK